MNQDIPKDPVEGSRPKYQGGNVTTNLYLENNRSDGNDNNDDSDEDMEEATSEIFKCWMSVWVDTCN
jgi:hypothetical protein